MQLIKTMTVLTLALTITACNKSGSGTNEAVASDTQINAPLAKDDALGNFIVVNQADEDIYVSSSASFDNDAQILFKLSELSTTINLNRYFSNESKLIRLYALKASDVEAFFEDNVVPVQSLDVLVQEGGTFSPFASTNTFDKFGELRVCNKTGKVLAFAFNDVAGPIEGMIGRTACNMPIDLPARGLLDVYFLDASTFALEESWSEIVAEGSAFRLDLGDGFQNDQPATLKVRSRLNSTVQIVDQSNQSALNNAQCDQCAYLPKNTTGEFELNALSDYLIEVRNLDGEVLFTSSEVLLLGSGEEAFYDLVVEDGLVLLKQVDQSAEVEVSDLEMTSFSGSCATYADGFYTTYGDLECDLQYLGDINLVQELAYEMVDIDGDYITKRYAQVYEQVTSSVASLYGDVTLRLNVLTKSGEYIQGTPLNIAIR